VGIRRGGVHLAERLRREIAAVTGREPPAGTLDIALYRDDLSERAAAPVVGPTEIRFPVTGKTIVLVDDVLYTGRTVRAALSELVDFGRPRRVLLAVLVDRGGRELPIAADVVGAVLEVPAAEQVEVRLVEGGEAEDAVVVKGRATP
jgi:pyrimidine operon attenuation protein/uracil phosphoribosyltransferase